KPTPNGHERPVAGTPPVPHGEGGKGQGLVPTPEALEALVATLRDSGGFALSVQTTGLDAMRTDLVGLAFATPEGGAVYLPLGHRGEDAPAQLPTQRALAALRPVLEDPAIPKRAHNAKFAMLVLARRDVSAARL